ncbi:DUF222 domain-containing protein [Gordonia sp. NPDC003425]
MSSEEFLGDPLDESRYDVDVEEENELPPAPAVAAMDRISDQLAADQDLAAEDLVVMIAHCQATVAAAQFRLLQAVSLLHDVRAEEYAERVGEATTGQVASLEAMAQVVMAGLSGADRRAEFGPDGLEQAMAEVGAVLSMPPAQARAMIVAGQAMRYRLPFTSVALSCGRIDLRRFQIAVARTELVDPELLEKVDCRLSLAIMERDQLSVTRFTALVDTIVAEVDPAAMKRRRARAQRDRDVQVREDRFAPGQSRVTAQVPTIDGARLNSRLSELADGVHDADPRTRAQRRADGLIALARGRGRLDCQCPACVSPDNRNADPENAEPENAEPENAEPEARVGDSDLDASARGVADGCTTPPPGPRAVIHVVVNRSTLDGADDAPAYIDGHGVVDAQSVRELAAEQDAVCVEVSSGGDSPVDGPSPMRYRPSRKLQTLVRTGELCCTFPGCINPVWTADLDHTRPFDHEDPESGGATTRRNLKPLCRFHHRVKTFTPWRDHQDPLGVVVFESPTGHMFYGNAFRGMDLFPALKPRPPDHPARSDIDGGYENARAVAERAQQRWDDAHPPPF